LWEPARCERADVGLLQANDAGIRAQAGVQLVASDVDRVDLPRAPLEQNLGKAAGRGADIEADAAVRVEAEMIERRDKFQSTAGDKRVSRLRLDCRIDRDFLG